MTVTTEDLQRLGAAAHLLLEASDGFAQRPADVGQRLVDGYRAAPNEVVRVDVSGGVRAITTTSDHPGVEAVGQPRMAPLQQRRLWLRDVTNVVPVSTYSVPFVRELSPQSTETAASAVAEGATKVDVSSTLSFQPIVLTTGEPLTSNFVVSDQLWSDSPAFVAYVNSRLPYLLRVREEIAAFTGNGETANAGTIGVLHDPDVTATSAGSGLIATLLAMCGTLAGQGGLPDALFCNAIDYYAALAAMSGSGYAATILDKMPPVEPTLSLPRGAAVGGDFRQGSVLLDRQSVTVEAYPQHADLRKYNQTLIQAEERAVWAVIAPWRFTYSTGITP